MTQHEKISTWKWKMLFGHLKGLHILLPKMQNAIWLILPTMTKPFVTNNNFSISTAQWRIWNRSNVKYPARGNCTEEVQNHSESATIKTALVCNQTGNAEAPQVRSGQQALPIAANIITSEMFNDNYLNQSEFELEITWSCGWDRRVRWQDFSVYKFTPTGILLKIGYATAEKLKSIMWIQIHVVAITHFNDIRVRWLSTSWSF